MGPLWNGEERRLNDDERRQLCFLHQDTIQKLLKDLKESQDTIHEIETVKIPASESFRGQVKIAGVIALAIWGLSFVYTKAYKEESLIEHDRMHDRITQNTKDIGMNRGDYKALIVEVRNLTKEVAKSNSLTEKFVTILIDHGPPQGKVE